MIAGNIGLPVNLAGSLPNFFAFLDLDLRQRRAI